MLGEGLNSNAEINGTPFPVLIRQMWTSSEEVTCISSMETPMTFPVTFNVSHKLFPI